MKKSDEISWMILCCLALLFSSCSTAHVAAPSGFLKDYSDLKQGEYFKQESIAGGVDVTGFKAVKVSPVDLSYLSDKTACDTGALEELGREFREDIEDHLKKEGFTITSNPSGNTLVVNLALTNVEPPNILLNAALTAATFVVPVPLPFDQDGKTAFEGRVFDGATGKEVVKFAEERTGSGDQMNVKAMTIGKYQKFTNTRVVFSGWAENVAKMLQDLTSGADVKDKAKKSKKGKAITKQVIGMAL